MKRSPSLLAALAALAAWCGGCSAPPPEPPKLTDELKAKIKAEDDAVDAEERGPGYDEKQAKALKRK